MNVPSVDPCAAAFSAPARPAGSGKLFRSYVKAVDACAACGERMDHQRADDFPPYIVVTIVGHLVLGGYTMTDLILPLTTWQHLAIWTPITPDQLACAAAADQGRCHRPAMGAEDARLRWTGGHARGRPACARSLRMTSGRESVTLAPDTPERRARPRDAASIMLLDRSGDGVRVLMGRRSSAHVFMPDLYVFPGGRRDPTDHRLAFSSDLNPAVLQALNSVRGAPVSDARARALALAALRELYEEAGCSPGHAACRRRKRRCPFFQISQTCADGSGHYSSGTLEAVRYTLLRDLRGRSRSRYIAGSGKPGAPGFAVDRCQRPPLAPDTGDNRDHPFGFEKRP